MASGRVSTGAAPRGAGAGWRWQAAAGAWRAWSAGGGVWASWRSTAAPRPAALLPSAVLVSWLGGCSTPQPVAPDPTSTEVAPEAPAPAPAEPEAPPDASLSPAAAPQLALPLDCTVGVDCWMTNWPDVDPGPGFRDPSGGAHSYDGHSGTDLAPAALGLAQPVWVRAPVAGKIARTRDGEPDLSFVVGGGEERDSLDDKHCGNGVAIDAGGGWEVMLCHLMAGSVLVRPGETVEVGQRLAQVGMSGFTNHPHVHLSVTRDRERVDPFTGRALGGEEQLAPGPMWSVQLPDPTAQPALVWAGFLPARGGREPRDVQFSPPVAVIDADEPALRAVAFLYRARRGDQVTFRIRTPDGDVRTTSTTHSRDMPREAWTIERALSPGAARERGLWTVEVEWRRGGMVERRRGRVWVR